MAVGLKPFNPNVVLKQLLEETLKSLQPQTLPTTTVSLTTNSNTIQVLITPANVAQVEDLFQGIVKGELQLNPIIHAKLKKLLKVATKAIANAKI